MSDVLNATGNVKLKGLRKVYGDFVAVHNLDLEIPQGSFFALLGPSGCGKTTTLRMIAGLDEPTSGQVLIGETDITHTKAHQRPVNTVFQNYALFPHMDIFENIAFGLRRRGQKDVTKDVTDALELVQLGHLAKRKPGQMSGGQQQRIALARAIVNKPQVLLLDEPLGALDLKLRRQMQLELKRIQLEVGLTFVHVTHDQEEAMTMADTIAVMNNGLIEQLGSPTDLYENPQTAFVANFLGQSNLFRATIDSVDAENVVASDKDGRYLLNRSRIAAGTDLTVGSKILVGIRPEKISVSTHEQLGGDFNHQTGTVRDASFFGVSTQYVIDTASGDHWMAFEQNSGGQVISAGTKVYATWKSEHSFGLPGSEDVLAGDQIAAEFESTGN
jgi:spermidine/putrescine transport system ATP-binding protein